MQFGDLPRAGPRSTMPTTMKSAALNAPWARIRTSRLGDVVLADPQQQHHEAELADRAVGEQQLEIVRAQGAQPAATIGDQPTPTTSGRQTPTSANSGRQRATR